MISLGYLLYHLDDYITFIYNNERSFLNRFAKCATMDLIEVSFGSESLKIVYTSHSGQHLCDSVKIEDFKSWMEEITNVL